MGGSSEDPEIPDDFHNRNPYMKNETQEGEKEAHRVQLTQKTFGEILEVDGRKYQKVEQMNITQLMTHETFREYIEGKKTMDDVAQDKINSLGVHYDLSTLHLNFENENAKTELFEKNAMSSDCLLYTSPSPRDQRGSRMPSSA